MRLQVQTSLIQSWEIDPLCDRCPTGALAAAKSIQTRQSLLTLIPRIGSRISILKQLAPRGYHNLVKAHNQMMVTKSI